MEVGFDDEGVVLALRARILVDAGAYSMYPWTSTMDTGMALGILPGPYRIRHYQVDAFSVATNKSPMGAYRDRPTGRLLFDRAHHGCHRRDRRTRPGRGPPAQPGADRRVPLHLGDRPRLRLRLVP